MLWILLQCARSAIALDVFACAFAISEFCHDTMEKAPKIRAAETPMTWISHCTIRSPVDVESILLLPVVNLNNS